MLLTTLRITLLFAGTVSSMNWLNPSVGCLQADRTHQMVVYKLVAASVSFFTSLLQLTS